jgi:hypothetical protein
MRFFVQLSRYLIGLWLLLSGALMLNEPAAFANKIEVYFSLMHLNALSGISIYWGMMVGSATFLLGLALLLGSFINITAWLTATYALLCICVTAYVSINHTWVEMPSFGEWLHWSPIAAFYRDIFVLVLSVFLLLGKNQIDAVGGFKWNVFFFVLAVIASIAFPYFTFTHGPLASKLPLKKGLDMRSKWAIAPTASRDSYATFFYYYNVKKQQVDSFGADKIGEHLKELSNKKKYLFEKSSTVLVRKGAVPAEAGFVLKDAYGRTVQDSVLNQNGLSLWFVFRKTNGLSEMQQRKMQLLLKSAEDNKIPTLGLSCLKAADSDKLRHDNNWTLPFLECANEEIIRQLTPLNPSLMLMHNGKIEQIWSLDSAPKDFSHF